MIHWKYMIKCMLKSKTLLFWSLAFPIFLGAMFYFMFGNINEEFKFEEIKLGMIHSEEDKAFMTILETLETDNNKKMFQVKELKNKKAAKKALEEEKIIGYIDFDKNLELTVKKSDIYSTIIKSVIDQYKEMNTLIEDVAENSPEKLQIFLERIKDEQEITIKEIPLKGQDKDSFTQYFYALLAMTCLIGSMAGLENGIRIQPNLSALAARRNVAPTKKMVQIGIDFLATYFLYCIITTIVLAVCIFVYKKDFGDNAFLVLLTTWVGNFTGIIVGNLIALIVKGSRKKKDAICVAFFMISSFLGGLQWGDITYYIEKSCPIVNRLNPATLIVNSFRSMMVFGDYREYAINIITLIIIGILCFIICVMKLRREKYASI